ncbi:hypothetical protein CDAR_595461 [Caerostris darwini]|uniref:Uncharacterized protein n=1 Tax=Caerostris darwini TaxID=1538125 RepID=A0AAV4SLZ8_9ARAC|nr:hypothetical protein CDAR_595461 [Caerostris darwini]
MGVDDERKMESGVDMSRGHDSSSSGWHERTDAGAGIEPACFQERLLLAKENLELSSCLSLHFERARRSFAVKEQIRRGSHLREWHYRLLMEGGGDPVIESRRGQITSERVLCLSKECSVPSTGIPPFRTQ